MPRTLRRAARLATLPLAGALVALALTACGDDDLFGEPPPITPTPVVEPTPGGSAPGADPGPGAMEPPSAERQVRDLLLRASLDLAGISDRGDVDAIALRLEHGEHETWFVITSGAGVFDILGRRTQVAAVFQRHTNGGWVEVAGRQLESAPTETHVELIEGVGDSEWIAVFGRIEGNGSTFELLRFNGSELTAALWWYSPAGEAARLIDLNGDGRRELVMDASDPSVLCPGCGVIDHREVIYHWHEGFLRAAELAPLERDGELAEVVEAAIRQAHAGLWREAASTLSAASAMEPEHAEVAWMTVLATRIADARLAHAGAEAQPLLTHVLAGEYGAAVELMRALDPEDAYDIDGPLVAGTEATRAPEVMGELLVEWASRAIDHDPALHEAYAVRALGWLLLDRDAVGEALADLERAVELAPEDAFYLDARASLAGEEPPAAEDAEE